MRPPEEVPRLRPGCRNSKLLLARGGEPRFLCTGSVALPAARGPQECGALSPPGHQPCELSGHRDPRGEALRAEGRETWTRTGATLAGAGGRKESLFLTWRGGGCSRRHLSAPSAAGAALTGSDLQEAVSRHGRLKLDTRATGHRGLSSCTPLSPQPRKPRGSLAGGSGSGWQRAPATGPCISTRPRVSPLPPRSLSFSL